MASILKPDQATREEANKSSGFVGVAGFNLDDFAEAGVRHLRSVEGEAGRILEKAHQEAVRIKEEARREGLAQGLAAAELEAAGKVRAAADKQVAEHIPLLESVVQQISDLEGEYLNSFRECLLGTTLAATERIVLARLDREPELLGRWAEAALAAAKTSRKLIIALHPETLVEHGERLEMLLASPGMPEETRIEPDETIEPAGIVVRCEGGAVEMTLSRQLERLDEMLRGT